MEFTDIFGKYVIHEDQARPAALGCGPIKATILGAITHKILEDKDASFEPIFQEFVTYLMTNYTLYGGKSCVFKYLMDSNAINAFKCIPASHYIWKRLRVWARQYRTGQLD